MRSNTLTPVVAGLAVGIAFVALFASTFSTIDQNFGKRQYLDVAVEGLKDSYAAGEKIDFVVKAKGFDHLCGFPMLRIADATDSGKVVHSVDGVWLGGGCDPDIRNIDEIWSLKDMGVSDDIMIINQGGNYDIIVEYGSKTIEKSFEIVDDIASRPTPILEGGDDDERRNSMLAISSIKSRGIGDCFFNCPHTHTIFIYDNGTGIHQEKQDGKRFYHIFQAPQQVIREIIDQINSLERKPPVSEEDSDVTRIDLYCEPSFTLSIISIMVNGKTEKTVCYPGVPEVVELQEKIELIQQEYDDGIVDCVPESAHPVADCSVYLPNDAKWRAEGDPSFLKPEGQVGEPIPVEVSTDDETKIEITYNED